MSSFLSDESATHALAAGQRAGADLPQRLVPERGDRRMEFGPDLANFYSGRGMKVYKPDERSLADIVNFVRP